MRDSGTRNADLRQMLRQYRREMQDELQSRIRNGRAGQPNDGDDDLGRTDVDTQGDIRFVLLEIRAETLTRIDEALARLDVGEYGTCFECGGQITDRRLRAAPFAVRCRVCEQQREQARGQAQQLAQRSGSLSSFSVAGGS
jgi:DnaK suppressor protein